MDSANNYDRKIKWQRLYEKFGVVIILLIVVVIFSIATPNFMKSRNLINIIRQVSFVGLVGLGATATIISGGIDLSSGSVIAAAGVVAASLAKDTPYPAIVPVLGGLGIGLIVGLLNGLLVSKAKIVPFIVTLGTMTAVRGFALLYTGGKAISSLNADFNIIGAGSLFNTVPYPILIFVVIAGISWVILSSTKFGNHLYAVGGNERAAIFAGINVARVKATVYIYSSVLAALSGIVLAARVTSGTPNAGEGYELNGISAAIIGGVSFSGGEGTIYGTIIGTLIIGAISNGMDLLAVNMYWQDIVNGAIIVLAVWIDRFRKR